MFSNIRNGILSMFFRSASNCVCRCMHETQIVPDVIDTAPKILCTLHYDKTTDVKPCDLVLPELTKEPPQACWNADKDSFYSLVMVNADSFQYEFVHWIVVNIPYIYVDKGEVFTSYVGAYADKGPDRQRFACLVFRQVDRMRAFKERCFEVKESRANFKTRDFMRKFLLTAPVAGNVFYSIWNEQVPELKKQAGLCDC